MRDRVRTDQTSFLPGPDLLEEFITYLASFKHDIIRAAEQDQEDMPQEEVLLPEHLDINTKNTLYLILWSKGRWQIQTATMMFRCIRHC